VTPSIKRNASILERLNNQSSSRSNLKAKTKLSSSTSVKKLKSQNNGLSRTATSKFPLHTESLDEVQVKQPLIKKSAAIATSLMQKRGSVSPSQKRNTSLLEATKSLSKKSTKKIEAKRPSIKQIDDYEPSPTPLKSLIPRVEMDGIITPVKSGIKQYSKENSVSAKLPKNPGKARQVSYQPIDQEQADQLISKALDQIQEQLDDDDIVEGCYFFPVILCPKTDQEATSLK
jgi:hypothetical protein